MLGKKSRFDFFRKMWMLLAVIFLWMIFFPFELEPASRIKPINQYYIDKYDYRRGMPEENVMAIVQTPDGYLWLGTMGGLYRFDGMSFEKMDTELKEIHAQPGVVAMGVDREGVLWIGSSQGVIKYEKGKFRLMTEAEGFPMGEVLSVGTDRNGNIWFYIDQEGLFFRENGKIQGVGTMQGLTCQRVYSLAIDNSGNTWVSGFQEGLFLSHEDRYYRFDLVGVGDNYAVYYVTVDSAGTVWAGTSRGLVAINSSHEIVGVYNRENGLLDSLILGPIIEEGGDTLWVATSQGLSRLVRQRDGEYIIENGLGEVTCFCMIRDREESIWIGSLGSGLVQVRDCPFQTYNEEQGVNPYHNAIYVNGTGELIAGSTIGQLYRFEEEHFNRFLIIDNTAIMGVLAIEEDHQGNLWIGTESGGLVQVKEGEIKIFTIKDGLGSNQVRVLTCDHQGRLWIGTRMAGVTVLEQGVFRVYGTEQGLASNLIYNVYEDRNKNIWLGTDNGLNLLVGGRLDRDSVKTFLKGYIIRGIHEDQGDFPQGVLWISTQGKGLIRFQTGQPDSFTSYTTAQGMGSDNLGSIQEDPQGYFWITSNSGILRENIKELNRMAAGEIKQIEGNTFGLEDGLRSMNIRRLAKCTSAQTGDGRLWFATQRGISAIHPGNIKSNKIEPPVVIKDILFDFERVSPLANGHIYRGVKDMRFRFTVPTFIASGRVRIRYRLEPFEEEWHEIDAFQEREAHYKNVPAGEYRFQVIAANNSGLWNEQGASFNFTLALHFYQTWLFKGSLAFIFFLALLTSVIGLKRYQDMRKLRQKYKNSTLDPVKAERVLKKAQYLLEVEKTYKDETLSLDSLAAKLAIAPRYLSQIVNERLNKNFRDFINGFRIEAAKELLVEPGKENSILDIALEVGFNSKEVFNRAFKKTTDMTPSDYKRKAMDKKT